MLYCFVDFLIMRSFICSYICCNRRNVISHCCAEIRSGSVTQLPYLKVMLLVTICCYLLLFLYSLITILNSALRYGGTRVGSTCPTARERSVYPQSFSGKILPHFDTNNLSVAQKLKKLEIGPFHLEL